MGTEKLRDGWVPEIWPPPAGKARPAWIQHGIHHLSPDAESGPAPADGARIHTQSGGQGEIPKKILEDYPVECIGSMPDRFL